MSTFLAALMRRDTSPRDMLLNAFILWLVLLAVEAAAGREIPHGSAVLGSVIGLAIGMLATNTLDIWLERRAKEPRHD